MKDVLNPIGTGAAAAIPGVTAWGKTGTTSNYADAWFVGSTAASGSVPSMTVAVWVGYPNSDKSMAKDYGGKPVYGGTYPALIWKRLHRAGDPAVPLEAAERRPSTRRAQVPTSSSTGAAGARAPAWLDRHDRRRTPNSAAAGATTPASGTVTSGGGSTRRRHDHPAAPRTDASAGDGRPAARTGRRLDGGLRRRRRLDAPRRRHRARRRPDGGRRHPARVSAPAPSAARRGPTDASRRANEAAAADAEAPGQLDGPGDPDPPASRRSPAAPGRSPA